MPVVQYHTTSSVEAADRGETFCEVFIVFNANILKLIGYNDLIDGFFCIVNDQQITREIVSMANIR